MVQATVVERPAGNVNPPAPAIVVREPGGNVVTIGNPATRRGGGGGGGTNVYDYSNQAAAVEEARRKEAQRIKEAEIEAQRKAEIEKNTAIQLTQSRNVLLNRGISSISERGRAQDLYNQLTANINRQANIARQNIARGSTVEAGTTVLAPDRNVIEKVKDFTLYGTTNPVKTPEQIQREVQSNYNAAIIFEAKNLKERDQAYLDNLSQQYQKEVDAGRMDATYANQQLQLAANERAMITNKELQATSAEVGKIVTNEFTSRVNATRPINISGVIPVSRAIAKGKEIIAKVDTSVGSAARLYDAKIAPTRTFLNVPNSLGTNIPSPLQEQMYTKPVTRAIQIGTIVGTGYVGGAVAGAAGAYRGTAIARDIFLGYQGVRGALSTGQQLTSGQYLEAGKSTAELALGFLPFTKGYKTFSPKNERGLFNFFTRENKIPGTTRRINDPIAKILGYTEEVGKDGKVIIKGFVEQTQPTRTVEVQSRAGRIAEFVDKNILGRTVSEGQPKVISILGRTFKGVFEFTPVNNIASTGKVELVKVGSRVPRRYETVSLDYGTVATRVSRSPVEEALLKELTRNRLTSITPEQASQIRFSKQFTQYRGKVRGGVVEPRKPKPKDFTQTTSISVPKKIDPFYIVTGNNKGAIARVIPGGSVRSVTMSKTSKFGVRPSGRSRTSKAISDILQTSRKPKSEVLQVDIPKSTPPAKAPEVSPTIISNIEAQVSALRTPEPLVKIPEVTSRVETPTRTAFGQRAETTTTRTTDINPSVNVEQQFSRVKEEQVFGSVQVPIVVGGTRVKEEPGSRGGTTFGGINVEDQINIDVQKPTEAVDTQFKLAQAQAQAQINLSKLKLDNQFRIIRPNISPRIEPTITPINKVPEPKSNFKERLSSLVSKVRTSYNVVTWKGGKPITIAKGLPEGRARKFAVNKILSTARASFKLIPSGTTSQEDIVYKLPKGFTTSKKDSLRFVQTKNTRLGTAGERMEVFKAKKANRSIKWF